ncbi:MAG: hypothetical protein KF895_15670 [Parvibaculum sp.]|uniref:helix-turn-helix domain-containing protein n=1 Tax=Chelatococcus sp. TaxID=1953771 RepID=UPI001ED11F24|nr:helix-turn-helix domain-containing protein [Chelatococcus sp.]MBX3506917.1 hypothetical protein [Parvibaculum sp.]MBX3545558.1 hypothetical protein [Chelatococcus sp.]
MTVSIRMCGEITAAVYEVPYEQLLNDQRQMALVEARHAAFWAAKRFTHRSLPAIGRVFRRDHTSVLHGARRIERLRQEDPSVAARLALIEAGIKATETTMVRENLVFHRDIDPVEVAQVVLSSKVRAVTVSLDEVIVLARAVEAYEARISRPPPELSALVREFVDTTDAINRKPVDHERRTLIERQKTLFADLKSMSAARDDAKGEMSHAE